MNLKELKLESYLVNKGRSSYPMNSSSWKVEVRGKWGFYRRFCVFVSPVSGDWIAQIYSRSKIKWKNKPADLDVDSIVDELLDWFELTNEYWTDSNFGVCKTVFYTVNGSNFENLPIQAIDDSNYYTVGLMRIADMAVLNLGRHTEPFIEGQWYIEVEGNEGYKRPFYVHIRPKNKRWLMKVYTKDWWEFKDDYCPKNVNPSSLVKGLFKWYKLKSKLKGRTDMTNLEVALEFFAQYNPNTDVSGVTYESLLKSNRI